MPEAIDKLDFILSGVLRVVYYRSLHMVSVPHGPEEVLAYARENAQGGRFGGVVDEVRDGPLAGAWLWRGINVGAGLTMDAWILGARGGAQTVIVRRGFWKGNFARRALGG